MSSYYQNLDMNTVKDSKQFWKRVSELFSDKIKSEGKITPAEKGEILINEYEIATRFNYFFSIIVENLNIDKNSKHSSKTHQEDPVLLFIKKFAKHPRIQNI